MSASPNPLSLLLPAYLNGTLNEAERRWVDEQLAASAQARAELAELRQLQGGLRAHWESDEAPSPSARARVMAAIAAAERAPAKTAAKALQPGLGERIGAALSALFAPRWVPAAALAIIVLQLGLLVSMGGLRLTGAPDVTTRGTDAPTRLTLVLKPDAKLADVTALLRDLRARMIGGPDAQGAYTLGVDTINPERVKQKLALARARSDVVASIDVAGP